MNTADKKVPTFSSLDGCVKAGGDYGAMIREKGKESPFVQPFLIIGRETWHVEINGEWQQYLTKDLDAVRAESARGECMFVINLLPYATPRLRHILAALERQLNKKIDHVSLYIGSAGPSHVLRGGIFFERMKQPEPGPTNFM